MAKRVLDPSKAPPTAINGYVDLATANFTPTNKLGGVMNNLTVGNTGGGQPVSAQVSANVPIMEPYLVMNYIICTEGIFPSRQ